ncbi:MAG: Rhomboid family protein [Bacteroidetes bacterium]|jgi:membrane associated rhomboid family serine protease|nr:Rhomboid family protein [Bacteroidota bacterium]MDF2450711.1 Rhomboid family protein [Bacteroidota bacterium]
MGFQEFKPRQFQQIPMVVKNILIINVLLYFGTLVFGELLHRYLDLYPIGTPYFKPYQFISYMFMHADIAHILFNMLAVYMFGSILENIWGPKRFLNFYLLCGLGAAFLQLGISYYNNEYTILLGASGAVFGLLVAFAMMFPNTELQIYFIIPVKAKYLVIGYALFELYNGFFAHDNVAHFAHLGGLAVGIIIMLIWKKNKTFFF